MFDLSQLRDAIAAYGPVARVVVAEIVGSVPREVGASMLIWETGQSGTIGGGTLEFEATKFARAMLGRETPARLSRHPLGPALGQCCGGSVSLVSEVFTAGDIDHLDEKQSFARQVAGDSTMPLSLKRAETLARNQGLAVRPQLQDGWFIEPLRARAVPLWIWGAGHVGRAMVQTLAGLTEFDITWIDTSEVRFPRRDPRRGHQTDSGKPCELGALCAKRRPASDLDLFARSGSGAVSPAAVT